MKHLHEMAEDEAIEYAMLKVPGCRPQPPHVKRCGYSANEWGHERGGTASGGHGEGGYVYPYQPETFRAVWFGAAWEWMERSREPYEVNIDPSDGTWGVRNAVKDDWVGDQFYRTKYHALSAAVLLAAGEPIP